MPLGLLGADRGGSPHPLTRNEREREREYSPLERFELPILSDYRCINVGVSCSVCGDMVCERNIAMAL